jgi:ubiquinone/menaquinone biosynthesis C-methylase UbiE
MQIDSFFTDHWRDIEDERIERYEQMFVWHDAQRTLVEPAELGPGMRVLDVGSGPGFFAGGLAGLVAPDGTVDGVDLPQTLKLTSII